MSPNQYKGDAADGRCGTNKSLGEKAQLLAQRIASLLLVREANHQALRVARAGFNPPPRPAELTLTYRGPFGPIGIRCSL